MDIKMFFEFPGILILIGIVLLILSIVVGLLAYRKVDKEEIVFSISEEDDKAVEEINKDNEVTIIDEPNLVESNMFDKDEIIKELEQTNELNVIEEIKEEPMVLEELPEVDNKVKIYGGNNPKIDINLKEEKPVVTEKQEEIEVL